MTDVTAAFARARAEDRAALIGYLPAGFPDRGTDRRLIEAMIDAGVDLIEIGIPYTDPVMDGPVICAAAGLALAGGTTTAEALALVGEVSGRGAAVVIMAYWNLIEQYGPQRFAADLAAAGGAGVITPDLTPEEGREWIAACDRHGLAHVFLAAPSTSDSRLPVIAGAATGFVYATALMGVTGVRVTLDDAAARLVARLRPLTGTPIAVGLGVSTGDQAAQVAAFADGVIVGSAFVRRVLDAPDADTAVAQVAALAGELAAAVARPGRTAH